MSYNRTTYSGKCYDLNGEDIVRISEIIKSLTGQYPDCTITLEDNSSISSKSVDDIVTDTVLNLAKIASVRFSFSQYNHPSIQSFSMNFDGSKMWGPANLSISGHRDAVGAATTQIYQFMEGKKRWFWFLNYSQSPALYVIYALVALSISAVLLVMQFKSLLTIIEKDYYILGMCVFVFALIVYVSLLKDLRNFLFPALALRIGRSGNSAKWRDIIRNFIIVSILIGIPLSIVGNIIYDKMK